MGKLFWSILCPFCGYSLLSLLMLEPVAFSSHFYLFCLYLTRQDFVFPCIPLFHLLARRAKKDEGLKVCGRKFSEDVSGLCSQGTSCSQCEHGTLSMRSISMMIIFILQQSGSRQHSNTVGGKGFFLPIGYTLCNILAVHTNKAMREEIMKRYQPSPGTENSHSSLTKHRVQLFSVSAPWQCTSSALPCTLFTAQRCGKCNISWLSSVLDR